MKVQQQLQREKNKAKQKPWQFTKIAVNQEEQSVDHMRGNKWGADYLQLVRCGKLMLNQFNKMHLFRATVVSASRGNLQSPLKIYFLGFIQLALGCCTPDA